MKLFWRIFLSFWFAAMLMMAVVLLKGEILPLSFEFPGDRDARFAPELVAPLLSKAADAYEQQGSAALSAYLKNRVKTGGRSLFLFDDNGNVLAGDTAPPAFYGQVARDVSQDGHAVLQWFGFHTLFVCPIQSASGQHYTAVLTIFHPQFRLLSPRFWFNLSIAMLPASLVCMVLSLYLARPISTLRSAAQRLAGGDLTARATRVGKVRRDELGELARDFDAMAVRIESLMGAQRRFVADVSHELGAPLTRLNLAVALLKRQAGESFNGELTRIERETNKLARLVQQLLLLAQMQAGSYPAENLAPISIRSMCESIVEDADFEAADHGIRIAGTWQDANVLAYPSLLRSAVDNVLRNAIRYSPPGSEVRLDCATDDGQNVVVDIVDRGPGVPESMLNEIFRPFFRTAPGRDSKSGGTGLGLAIASEAVSLHDGTITARNRREGGLQVTVTIPLWTIPAVEEPNIAQRAECDVS
ncbi:MAG TPA: ATP-binding protein [Blastocatellia bacterium]